MSEEPVHSYPSYHRSPVQHQQADRTGVFPLRVTRVDYERRVLSVRNLSDNQIYDEVAQFPVTGSGPEDTDGTMPTKGWGGLGVFSSDQRGFVNVVVIAWTYADMASNVDAIAHRPGVKLEGYSTRKRGVYRKAYPGQRSRTLAEGLTELEGAGWDTLAADMSQDRLDPERRQRTQITGRGVVYDDAGLRFSGTVQRPGADKGIVPEETLPDGSKRQIVYLQEKKHPHDRYFKGQKDMLPFAETVEKIQEFGLDFPVPWEVLDTEMLDEALGVRRELWKRTSLVTQADGIMRDDQAFLTDQKFDHPHDPEAPAIGPSRGEGPTPRRRGWLIEKVQGTLVGYNRWDKATYGKVLKPSLWPRNAAGRFGTDLETGHLPVEFSDDHVESRLAATAFLMRFPFEYNTTRLEVTKEGMVLLEIGATIPKENIQWDPDKYEHPWGAGRSLEAHLVGSAKMVIGKNRDEEESLDLTTLGQVVMRLGADDSSFPQEGRSVAHQTREKADAIMPRDLQWWKRTKLQPGDAGSLDAGQKTGAENVSLRAATDGGVFLRLGARHEKAKRRHLKNGYADGQGSQQDAPGQGSRSRTKGRPVYGVGDAPYRFADLRNAAKPTTGIQPYFWSGDPVKDMDVHGLSADIHAVRDIFIRVGKNRLMDQSILLDLEGGIVGIVGKDKKGRSLTGSLMGGIELTIGANSEGRGVQLEILGDVNMAVKGNYHVHATGSITFDSMKDIFLLSKGEAITKAINIRQRALVQHVSEAPDVVHQQGGHPETGD